MCIETNTSANCLVDGLDAFQYDDAIIVAEGGIPTWERETPLAFLKTCQHMKVSPFPEHVIEFGEIASLLGVTPDGGPGVSLEQIHRKCTWNWLCIALILAEAFDRHSDTRTKEQKTAAVEIIANILDSRGGVLKSDAGTDVAANDVCQHVRTTLSNMFIIAAGEKNYDVWEKFVIRLDHAELRTVVLFLRHSLVLGARDFFCDNFMSVVRDVIMFARASGEEISASFVSPEDEAMFEHMYEICGHDWLDGNAPSVSALGKKQYFGKQVFVSIMIAFCSRIGICDPDSSVCLPDEATASDVEGSVGVLHYFLHLLGCIDESKEDEEEEEEKLQQLMEGEYVPGEDEVSGESSSDTASDILSEVEESDTPVTSESSGPGIDMGDEPIAARVRRGTKRKRSVPAGTKRDAWEREFNELKRAKQKQDKERKRQREERSIKKAKRKEKKKILVERVPEAKPYIVSDSDSDSDDFALNLQTGALIPSPKANTKETSSIPVFN